MDLTPAPLVAFVDNITNYGRQLTTVFPPVEIEFKPTKKEKSIFYSQLNFRVGIGHIINDELDYTKWSTQMSDAEIPCYSMEAELSYSKSHQNGFFIEGGINYQRQIFKMSKTDSTITNQTVEHDTTVIVGTQELILSGESEKRITNYLDYKVFNKYHNISFPIRIGYSRQFSKNEILFKGGVRMASISFSKGYAINQDNLVQPQKDFDTNRFVGLHSYDLSLNYGRQIHDKYKFYLGIQYQAGFNNQNLIRRNDNLSGNLGLSIIMDD